MASHHDSNLTTIIQTTTIITSRNSTQLHTLTHAAQSTTIMPRHAHSRPLTPETHTHTWHCPLMAQWHPFHTPVPSHAQSHTSPHPISNHIIHRCHLHDLTAYHLDAAQPFPPLSPTSQHDKMVSHAINALVLCCGEHSYAVNITSDRILCTHRVEAGGREGGS